MHAFFYSNQVLLVSNVVAAAYVIRWKERERWLKTLFWRLLAIFLFNI
jgi:hypothetical protein